MAIRREVLGVYLRAHRCGSMNAGADLLGKERWKKDHGGGITVRA